MTGVKRYHVQPSEHYVDRVVWEAHDGEWVKFEDHAAALSAQPSPGGQDALVDEALDYFDRAGDAGDRKYVAAIRAALAARQPVEFERAIPTRRRESAVELLLQLGFVWNNQRWEDRRQPMRQEPVAYVDLANWKAGLGADECFFTDWQDDDTVPLYAAPPAQAVDLGQFREAVERLKDDALHERDPGPAVNAYNRVRALIDNQA